MKKSTVITALVAILAMAVTPTNEAQAPATFQR